MNKYFRFVVSLLLSLVLVASSVLPSLAAEWNGSTADPSIGGSSPSAGGYGIKGTWANKPSTIMALRFSFYNADTGETKGTTLDVFKSEYADYMNWNKLDKKYNKLQLRELYNNDNLTAGFTIDNFDSYVEDDARLGLADGLPDYTSELAEWQTDDDNLNALLLEMDIEDVGSIYDFQTGDYMLVEPMYPVYIDGAWFVLTVTEIAVLGAHPNLNGVGEGYEGLKSEANSGENWKFIAEYTNKHFPNSLFLDKAWCDSAENAILDSEFVPELTKKTTFDAIINNGYGIGIAFTFEELGERRPTFDIKYDLNVLPLTDKITVKYIGEELWSNNTTANKVTTFYADARTRQTFTLGQSDDGSEYFYKDALLNVSDVGGWHVYRDGYVWTGRWNTKFSGKGISIDWDVDMTAAELAETLGVDLTEEDPSITLYMEWEPIAEDPHVLTVKYHTNGADMIVFGGLGQTTEDAFFSNKDKSVFISGLSYIDALRNMSLSSDGTLPSGQYYAKKEGHAWTGYWNTSADGSGIRIKWDVDVSTEELASILGVDLSNGDQTVDVYMEWVPDAPEPVVDAKYTVNHILMDTSGLFPSKPHETETFTGAPDTILTLADLAKSYTGFSYSHGVVDGSIVATTTILEDGSRIINLLYARSKYTVTLTKNTGIDEVIGAGTYYYGESVTINATLSAGYSWNYWIATGFGMLSDQEYTFTMPASNVTGYAYAKPNTLTVIYNSNGSDSILYKGSVRTEGKFQTDATDVFTYGKSYTDALTNASDNAEWFVTRTDYTWTGYWNTSADGSGIRIKWDVDMTAEELAVALGTDISTENKTITLYMEWEPIPDDSELLYVDYDGNGATSGEGWSETINASDITKYMLSSNQEAFSRVEEDANGVVTQFKFMGWEIDGEFYQFSEEIPVEKLLEAAETVSDREYAVVTIYAYWDEFPVVEAVDRWFTLEEAQNGDITIDELLRTGTAVDGEVGDKTDFASGEGTYTIIDYAIEDFTQFTATGSVTVTYVAIDKVGNKVKTIVTVYIVDQNQTVENTYDSSTKYIRFISKDYFKDVNGEFIEAGNGGLADNSAWKTFFEYEKALTDALNNKKNEETGDWETVYETWTISKSELAEAKNYIEEHGLGKTQTAYALENFYLKFYVGNS